MSVFLFWAGLDNDPYLGQPQKDFHRHQTGVLKKEHTQIEDKLDTLVDLLMEKTIEKEEFEVKKKRLKDRQYQIDNLIRSYDEADDAFNETLLNLVELGVRVVYYFKVRTSPASGSC